MKKMVYILRGLPGSGKSHLASKLAVKCAGPVGHSYAVRICSADHFFVREDGSYKFDKRLVGRSHAECLASFLDGLAKGFNNLIVDNTNSQCWEYGNYETLAKSFGFEVKVIEIQCKNRQTAMAFHQRNIHGVPESAHVNMWQRWEADPRATLMQPWTAQHLSPVRFRSVPDHSTEEEFASDSEISRPTSCIHSPFTSRGATPLHSRGASPLHSRGASPLHSRGASPLHSRGASPPRFARHSLLSTGSQGSPLEHFYGFQESFDTLGLEDLAISGNEQNEEAYTSASWVSPTSLRLDPRNDGPRNDPNAWSN